MGGAPSVVSTESKEELSTDGKLMIPLSGLCKHLRLYQHITSGQVLILVDQDIHYMNGGVLVGDPLEWYEVQLSSQQRPYFNSIHESKTISVPPGWGGVPTVSLVSGASIDFSEQDSIPSLEVIVADKSKNVRPSVVSAAVEPLRDVSDPFGSFRARSSRVSNGSDDGEPSSSSVAPGVNGRSHWSRSIVFTYHATGDNGTPRLADDKKGDTRSNNFTSFSADDKCARDGEGESKDVTTYFLNNTYDYTQSDANQDLVGLARFEGRQQLSARLVSEFGSSFILNFGKNDDASLVCRTCLEQLKTPSAGFGAGAGFGGGTGAGAAGSTEAYMVEQRSFDRGLAPAKEGGGPPAANEGSDASAPSFGYDYYRALILEHSRSCLSSAHLSELLMDLDIKLRPVCKELKRINQNSMYVQLNKALRNFEDSNTMNNAVLKLMRRVMDVQLAQVGLHIPSASLLLTKLDSVIQDINAVIFTIRQWLAGETQVEPSARSRSSTLGPSNSSPDRQSPPHPYNEPPPVVDVTMEQELFRHVDILVELLEVAIQKRQILQSFRQSNVDLVNFEFVRTLAHGGFSTVYLARQVSTGSYVTIKCMSKASVRQHGLVDRVLLEQRILRASSRSQPDLFVLFHASFQTSTHLFIALEFIPGGDCATLLASQPTGRLPEPVARQLVAELAFAVKHMHDHGVIHRDLKPDNILVSASGHIKVSDFGSAGVRDRRQNPHAVQDPRGAGGGGVEGGRGGVIAGDDYSGNGQQQSSGEYSYGGLSYGGQQYGLRDKVPQWLDIYGLPPEATGKNRLGRGHHGHAKGKGHDQRGQHLGTGPGPGAGVGANNGAAPASSNQHAAATDQYHGAGGGDGTGTGTGTGTTSTSSNAAGGRSSPTVTTPERHRNAHAAGTYSPNSMVGNYHYAAPEIALCSPNCAHEVDWWAVGVIMFQFVTGVLPFTDHTRLIAELTRRGVERERFFDHLRDYGCPAMDPDTAQLLSVSDRDVVVERIVNVTPAWELLPPVTTQWPFTVHRNDLLQVLWAKEPHFRLGHVTGALIVLRVLFYAVYIVCVDCVF